MKIRVNTIGLFGGNYTRPGDVVDVDAVTGAVLVASGQGVQVVEPAPAVEPPREETIDRAVQDAPREKAVRVKGK